MITFSPSFISPIAIPATGAFIGTPASIRASEPPHTVAIEDEPFDSSISATILIVYGKSDFCGINAFNALSANMPCPISLRPGDLRGFTSPTLKGGKL